MAALVAGLGYMGAALAEALIARGEPVVGLDNRFSTDERAIERLSAAGLTFVPGDIAAPDEVAAVFAHGPFETIYLFAAQASANPQAASVEYTERSNLIGPRVLLDAALAHGVQSVVYASSFKVYGERLARDDGDGLNRQDAKDAKDAKKTTIIDEGQPYGVFRDMSHLSKVHVEKLLEMYSALHGLRCLSLRFGIVHGLGPVFKTDPRFMTAPNLFCWRAARGEPLTVFGGGRTPAGFVHVADATAATLAAADHAGFRGYVPLNVVGEVVSVAEVAGWVRDAGAARGLAVRIEGLDPAGSVDEAARYAVASGLDAVPYVRPGHLLRKSVGEVLDYFLAGAA
ncbi:MAG: NAD(P)-dependent oxidoreductase [Thermomicrobiales bacterium]